MIISRAYAKKLILTEDAVELGKVKNSEGREEFMAIDRLDLQRVDHYQLSKSDFN